MSTTRSIPRPRKLPWLLALAPLTAIAVVAGWIGPVGTTPAPPKTLVELPVSASQRGPWTVGVNSLPPVTGTVSITGTPTVNVANLPAATPAPLWQGTPYIEAQDAAGPGCSTFGPFPAGTVLFAERVVVRLEALTDGPIAAALDVDLPGATQTTSFHVPLQGRPSFAGPQGQTYAGTLELGLPVESLSVCAGGDAHFVTVMGYLMPAP